jgi:hypothetical protein
MIFSGIRIKNLTGLHQRADDSPFYNVKREKHETYFHTRENMIE